MLLREKCPNMEFFLVRIFLYLNRIRRFTRKSPYSARIQENTDQEKKKTPYLDTFHVVHFVSLVSHCVSTVYFVSVRIQSECRKIRTRKISVFGHFSRRFIYVALTICAVLSFSGCPRGKKKVTTALFKKRIYNSRVTKPSYALWRHKPSY